MCTVSWTHGGGNYHLLSNRDEKRTRRRAELPQIRRFNDVCTIAPADGDFGGTWIGVNEFGVTLCLLNGYRSPVLVPHLLSRGNLIPKVLDAHSAANAIERLAQESLTQFAPFTVIALDLESPARMIEWTGSRKLLTLDASRNTPLASSSVDHDGVQAHRKSTFESKFRSGRSAVKELIAFHADHGASADAYSTCMHRDDAETVSFSHVTVSPERVQFLYTDGPLCRNPLSFQLSLPRRTR